MEIKLNDNKRDILLRGNDGTFELCEQRNVKKHGKPTKEWTAFGWFCSLESALTRFADYKLSNSDAKSIEELQAEVKKLRKEITDIYDIMG